MTGDIDRVLGAAWRDDEPWEFLTSLCEIGDRMGGHHGEQRAAELVAAEFETAGVADVVQCPFALQRWTRGRTELGVTEPVARSFEALALPYSPAGEARGELVDVGHGTPEEIDEADVEGRIVVASTDTPPGRRFVHRMEKYGHAIAAGAAAFVFVNHVPGQLPPTGSLRFDEEGTIPGVGVSRETGDWLQEYARRDGVARLSVDATTDRGESQTIHGTLGPETDEEVLVVGHYDAHDVAEGALDNGCGIAIVVTVARMLADLDPGCRVRVAGVGCEEVGLLGSEALADALDRDRIRAVVNVDGAGRYRDLKAITHASPALTERAEALERRTGHPIVVDEDPLPYSDHWPFLRAGVPCLQLHSERREGDAPGGVRGRGWTHTAADTRDKVDPRTLREHAMLATLFVLDLANEKRDLPRVAAADLRERMCEHDLERGMRAAGIWPDDWTD